MEVGKEHHFDWLKGIVVVTLVLNLLDAILTLVWVSAGMATEANPVMDAYLNHGPVVFVLVKIILVSAGSYLLWLRRDRHLAVVGILLMFLAYYFILLFHLRAMNLGVLTRWFS